MGHLPLKPDREILAALVRRAQAGDPASLRELLSGSQARLHRFCLFLTGRREAAQDLSQATCLRALETLASLRDPYVFWAWLYRVARNLFLDQLRRNDPTEQLPEESAVEAPCGGLEEALQVRQTLAALDPSDRAALVLSGLEERSYEEVALALGVSEAAVKSRLHRARKSFLTKFSA